MALALQIRSFGRAEPILELAGSHKTAPEGRGIKAFPRQDQALKVGQLKV
jgi:hypothetical protein